MSTEKDQNRKPYVAAKIEGFFAAIIAFLKGIVNALYYGAMVIIMFFVLFRAVPFTWNALTTEDGAKKMNETGQSIVDHVKKWVGIKVTK